MEGGGGEAAGQEAEDVLPLARVRRPTVSNNAEDAQFQVARSHTKCTNGGALQMHYENRRCSGIRGVVREYRRCVQASRRTDMLL